MFYKYNKSEVKIHIINWKCKWRIQERFACKKLKLENTNWQQHEKAIIMEKLMTKDQKVIKKKQIKSCHMERKKKQE